MTDENVQEFSRVLEVRAVMIDAKYVCHCRRPRFFWPSWEVQAQDEEKLVAKADWDEWVFPIMRPMASEWPEEAWTPEAHTWLPTFTRPQRRKKPPVKPAGVDKASNNTMRRWEHDSYFVQV